MHLITAIVSDTSPSIMKSTGVPKWVDTEQGHSVPEKVSFLSWARGRWEMVPSLPPFTMSLRRGLAHGKLLLCSYKIILCKETFTKWDNQGLHFDFLDKPGIILALIEGSLCCQSGGEMKLQINNVQAQTQATPLTSLFKYLVSLVKIHRTSKLLAQRFLREAKPSQCLREVL